MTRVTVACEGVMVNHNTFLAEGALTFPEDRVPLTMTYDRAKHVGWARDFDRNVATGEISCEVELFPECEKWLCPDWCDYTIGATDVLGKVEDDERIVVSAGIREVSASPLPGRPNDDGTER